MLHVITIGLYIKSEERKVFQFKTEKMSTQDEQISPTPRRREFKSATIEILEQDIIDWIHKVKPTSSKAIRKYAKELINPVSHKFKASRSWLRKFSTRHCFELNGAAHTNDMKLEHSTNKKRRGASCPIIPPLLEQDIVDWVHMQRQPILLNAMREYALEMLTPIFPDFKASMCWAIRFIRRNSMKTSRVGIHRQIW